MMTIDIHAELHPRLLVDARSRKERERIASEYEPSARELFANREQIIDDTARPVTSRHRWGRQEKQKRHAKIASLIPKINRISERIRSSYAGVSYGGRGA